MEPMRYRKFHVKQYDIDRGPCCVGYAKVLEGEPMLACEGVELSLLAV